jgi:transposase
LKYLDLHERRLKELRERIQEEAKRDEGMKLLQTVAGVGPRVAYAYVAQVGDGSRFSKGAQVNNYLGFVPRLDYSGTIQRQGHITKRGLLIQAAWSAVRPKQGGALRERYRCRTAGAGTSKKKTIVSIGWRLAEIMYAVLRNKTEYEPRPWKGARDGAACLAGQALKSA